MMTVLWSLLCVAFAGSGGGGAEPGAGRLHLEPQQEARLGIEVAEVYVSTEPVSRTYRGVLVAPGTAAGLSFAPLSGGEDAETSARVAAQWATAAEAVRIGETDLELARSELERASRLAAGNAGSGRRLEEARAAVARSEDRLRGARERESYARRLIVGDQSQPWVRVPVYLGDRGGLDLQAPALLSGLGRGAVALEVPVASGARSANPSTGTFDVFYDAAGYDGRLGEAVSVAIPTTQPESSSALPQAAVVYDPFGVSWVYVRHEAGTYERVRAPLRSCRLGVCLLAGGPPVGASVVTAGAPELFGHDLGMGR